MKRLILLVEDEAALVGMLSYNLEKEGYRVRTAGDGEEALLAMREERPDIVVLDYCLPDGDGVTLAVEILKDFPHVHPVIMSGVVLEEEEVLVCQRYDIPILVKPFLEEELMKALAASSLKEATRRRVVG